MSLETLIIDMKESLEREMRAGFEQVNQRLKHIETRFEIQAARLDRQAALIQTGTRWISRMGDWSEKADKHLDELGKQDLEHLERIQELERRLKNGH